MAVKTTGWAVIELTSNVGAAWWSEINHPLPPAVL